MAGASTEEGALERRVGPCPTDPRDAWCLEERGDHPNNVSGGSDEVVLLKTCSNDTNNEINI